MSHLGNVSELWQKGWYCFSFSGSTLTLVASVVSTRCTLGTIPFQVMFAALLGRHRVTVREWLRLYCTAGLAAVSHIPLVRDDRAFPSAHKRRSTYVCTNVRALTVRSKDSCEVSRLTLGRLFTQSPSWLLSSAFSANPFDRPLYRF